jgi:hypothetical protein
MASQSNVPQCVTWTFQSSGGSDPGPIIKKQVDHMASQGYRLTHTIPTQVGLNDLIVTVFLFEKVSLA